MMKNHEASLEKRPLRDYIFCYEKVCRSPQANNSKTRHHTARPFAQPTQTKTNMIARHEQVGNRKWSML